MFKPRIADVRRSVTTSANSCASVYRACELGFDRVLAEAILSPEEDDFPATLLFVPTHDPAYLKLRTQNVFNWNIEVGMRQSLEAPDYLSVILAEVKKLREFWIYCAIKVSQLDLLFSILGSEDMGKYDKLVIVLPQIKSKATSPYRICSPHSSAQVRYVETLGGRWLDSQLRGQPAFAPYASFWNSYQLVTLP